MKEFEAKVKQKVAITNDGPGSIVVAMMKLAEECIIQMVDHSETVEDVQLAINYERFIEEILDGKVDFPYGTALQHMISERAEKEVQKLDDV